MKIIFEHHFKDIPKEQIPRMFDILAGNMRIIAPTGDSYEDDRRIWLVEAVPAFEHVILILDDGQLAGYFQYRLQDNTLRMDEIQFAKPYQGSGLFRRLYQYIITIIPQDTQHVAACANKMNQKAQNILEYLGLQRIGENKNGKSFIYSGEYQAILEKYGSK
ncbi:MAG: GNAT family N-acetyltransferase [Victivallales bacterium]|nr:GNAT family N-acetyltransferase [Victivallales bacterium]